MTEVGLKTITAAELAAFSSAGRPIELIDVRTPIEFRAVHAEQARSVPLDILDPATVMESRNCGTNEPVYLICKSVLAVARRPSAFVRPGSTTWSVLRVERRRGSKLV